MDGTTKVQMGVGERRGSNGARALGAALVALVLVGLAGCGAERYRPGIDPGTAGPLTREQAELLVEEPLAELLGALGPLADDGLEPVEPGAVTDVGGSCLWSSALHAGTAGMDEDLWDELTEQVRPAVSAWGMEENLLDRPERSAGAGLVAENPVNGARLEVQDWNPPTSGGEPPAEPGAQQGFSVQVTVPLAAAECA